MFDQVLNDRKPLNDQRTPGERGVARASMIAAAVTVVTNVVLVLLAASDGSWGALGIIIMIGPATNGLLALTSLGLIPAVWRVADEASIAPYVLTATLLPLAAILVDAACILSMDLSGC